MEMYVEGPDAFVIIHTDHRATFASTTGYFAPLQGKTFEPSDSVVAACRVILPHLSDRGSVNKDLIKSCPEFVRVLFFSFMKKKQQEGVVFTVKTTGRNGKYACIYQNISCFIDFADECVVTHDLKRVVIKPPTVERINYLNEFLNAMKQCVDDTDSVCLMTIAEGARSRCDQKIAEEVYSVIE